MTRRLAATSTRNRFRSDSRKYHIRGGMRRAGSRLRSAAGRSAAEWRALRPTVASSIRLKFYGLMMMVVSVVTLARFVSSQTFKAQTDYGLDD